MSGVNQQMQTGTEPGAPPTGCYLYCLGRAHQTGPMSVIGIGGKEVCAVEEAGLCALVHYGSARPYSSRDPKEVADWVMAHHRVVQTAWHQWGTVLPITFNTIISGDSMAPDNLRRWLKGELEQLEQRLQALEGMAEYGVQVFCDLHVIGRVVAGVNPQIQVWQKEVASGSRGRVYLSRRQIERTLQRESQVRISQEVEAICRRVSSCVSRLRVERVQDVPGERTMVLNLSCLFSRHQCVSLEAELDRISGQEGFSVRLVGPLPPYSFC